ncbi:calcium/calmodulin-dependent 3',5'-cyclic nucleotide phosphodiesterase 1C-like [Oncorhynchus mykiss]|uniref:calcium/calmodulin-dependent 3',5'-cyclic nucleotide phosphodiesterase 1C-like n=1 Tax=Oncorhynchus mykiss TaxID=8022 RepID=UPI000B4F9899|nr:calcium/calmodulin-dependent 3',5'-cyclic nucleotide phosphodiesterase 1C-like [Oncorhynchus mykiss]
MTEPSSKSSKKQGFKKCRSATFSIDGFSFTIVANKAGETTPPPLNRFARSKSQNALWNAITAGIGIKDKDKRGILIDPRSPEEILADDLPVVDGPDAMEKTAISVFVDPPAFTLPPPELHALSEHLRGEELLVTKPEHTQITARGPLTQLHH